MLQKEQEPLQFLLSMQDFSTLDGVDGLGLFRDVLSTPVQTTVNGEETYTAVSHSAATAGQWHLENTTGGWDINVLTAWEDYTGNGVLVGIVDEGVQHQHYELSGNYDTSKDWDYVLGNNDGGSKSGSDRHGTSVAGNIAAANDGSGSTGVAYDATITSFRLLGGAGINTSMIQGALGQDVDVSNNSWGFTKPFAVSTGFANVIEDTLQSAVQNNRDGLGTVFVFSAGNSRTDFDNVNYDEMANSRFTIAVAAGNSDGTYSYFSTPGTPVLVTAPGTSIYTTDLMGSSGYSSGDYTTVQGTSFSAPITSGVVALMLEANPLLGYRDVQEILAYSSRLNDAGNAMWETNGAGNWNGGGLHVNENYGFGYIDATAAVRMSESWFVGGNTARVFNNESSLSFNSGTINQTFDNSVLTSTLNVASGMNIDHVELQLNLTHSRIQDLVIELISPDGTNSLMFDRPPASVSGVGSVTTTFNTSWDFSSTHHWGETGVGDWTLRISDQVSGYSGTLSDWNLNFYGDLLNNDDTYFYTDAFADYTGAGYAANRLLADADGSDTINAAAVTSDLSINLTAGSVNTIAGNTLTIDGSTTIENVIGGDGNDILTGNVADNILYGGRGNDTLNGGYGDDTMIGGLGDDTYYVDSLGDTVIENVGEGYDVIYSSIGNYTLSANVELLQLIGNNTNVVGSSGSDTITGSSGTNTIDGGGGNDLISGMGGNDTLIGGAGDDTIDGGDGNDALDGGDGNDTYKFNNAFGTDTLADASGTDTLDFSGVVNVPLTVDLSSTGMSYGSNSITWGSAVIENVIGTGSSDVITGNSADNVLTGGEGADTLSGGDGADTLDGGGWSDILNGGNGNDILDGGVGYDTLNGGADDDTLTGGAGNDTLNGGSGSDTYIFADGWGVDTLSDSSGTDTVDFSGHTSWVRIDLNNNGYATDGSNYVTFTGALENAIGGAGDDTLIGGTSNNILNGGAGNDTYKFRNVFSQDTIVDSAGVDTVDFTLLLHAPLVINLTSSAGAEASYGTNTINWDNDVIENATGANFGDTITGNAADNILDGGYGNDILSGLAGNDTLIGGEGADTLIGGTGNDVLRGNAGADTYIFEDGWGNDIGSDSSGGDILDFSAVTTNLDASLYLSSVSDEQGNSFIWTGRMEHLYTGSGNDILTGNDVANNLNGGAGDDIYKFRNIFNQDTITDASGNDTVDFTGVSNVALTINLTSSAGAEASYGVNTINWDNDAIENVVGGQSTDLITGNSAANTLNGHWGNDTIYGMGGDDTLLGDSGNDTIYGGDGNDHIDGGSWSDILYGDAGNDTITGGSGNDTLNGGTGDDVLIGGSGWDTYTGYDSAGFGADTIRDESGIDTLDLQSFTLADVLTWSALDSDNDTYFDSLKLDWGNGDSISVENYFDNLATDASLARAGAGYLESITFSDDTVTLGDMSSLIA